MRALKISGINFKGQTFSELLNAVTIIRGPNAAGKSSRIEAIPFTIAGFLPGLTNAAGKPVTQGSELIRLLGCGQHVRTEMETDTGILWRDLKEVHGSVKHTHSDSCDSFGMPPVALDPNIFLSLSGPEATKFMFARAKLGDDFTIPRLSNSITANVKNIVLEENTEATQAVISEIVEYISNDAFECAGDVTPQQWVATLTPAIKEQLRLANENSRRMAATVQGLTQIKEVVAVAGDFEAQLAKARSDLDAANAEVSRLRQVGVQRREELDKAEQAAKGAVNEDEIRRKLSAMTPPPVSASPGEKPVAKVMATARPTDSFALITLQKADAELQAANRARVSAEQSVDDIQAKIEAAQKQTTCPTCGHDTTDQQKKVVAGLKKLLKVAECSMTGAITEHDKKTVAMVLAQDDFKAVTESINQWNSTNESLYAEYRKEMDAYEVRVQAYNKSQADLNQFNSDVAALNAQLSGNAAAREAAESVPKLQTNLESARLLYAEAVDSAKIRKLTLEGLDELRLKLEKQRADAAVRAVSVAEAAKFKTEATILKQVVNLMETLQSEIVKQSIQPLLDKANELCGDILRLPVTFEDGEFGMRDKHGMVTKTMSDSEKLLAYAGLSLALATEAPFKLAVLGRFESFDVDRRHMIIQRAIELIRDKKLDQCLFVEVGTGSDYQCFEAEPEFTAVTLI